MAEFAAASDARDEPACAAAVSVSEFMLIALVLLFLYPYVIYPAVLYTIVRPLGGHLFKILHAAEDRVTKKFTSRLPRPVVNETRQCNRQIFSAQHFQGNLSRQLACARITTRSSKAAAQSLSNEQRLRATNPPSKDVLMNSTPRPISSFGKM
jgi:hypothetical protein